MVKAALIDRDSTLIKDKGYTFRADELIWEQNAIAGLSLLDSMGYKLIVITNQSGIARGYYTEKKMNTFHTIMNDDLKQKAGIVIEKFYHCPHHPDGKLKQYSTSCICRKPGDELFQKAISDFSIETNHSLVIGNNLSDIIPAVNQGINKGYLLYNNGSITLMNKEWPYIKVVNNWMGIIESLNDKSLWLHSIK